MGTLSVSVRVAASQERTFAGFTELEKAADRIPQIKSVEILTDGPFGEGTRWRETRVVMKKEATEEMQVAGFQPPHSYRVEANSRGMQYSTLFTFEPDGDGTKVTWNFTGTPETLGAKIMAPVINLLMTGTMRKFMRADLEAIRDDIERSAS